MTLRTLLCTAVAASLLLAAPLTPADGQTKSRTSSTSSKKSTTKSTRSKVRTTSKRTAVSKVRRPSPPRLSSTQPSSADALSRDLGSMLSRSTGNGRWGVLVVSLTTGDTLFGQNADEMLLPASTMKLYTSAAALEQYGPAHQFRTEVLRDGPLQVDGTIRGNLYLKGAGDPSFSIRSAAWNAGMKPMDALAAQVQASGVKRVTGDLIGDASAFDGQRIPDGWRTRYLHAGYAARVSALSYNENLATLIVKPSASGATVTFEPDISGLPIESTVRVKPGSSGAAVSVRQDPVTGKFRVNGWIGSRAKPRSYQMVVENPELWAAAAFRSALQARGVLVDGQVRVASAPTAALRVTAWASAPLAQLVARMNGESNNHFAELLFRNNSRLDGGTGSAPRSNLQLQRFLADKAGVNPSDVHAADGSGLSTLDRVTPRSMVQLLGYVNRAPWGAVLQASLPVAGMTETLRNRMKWTAAQGNLRAKTGTTNEVASLGGFVTARNGEQLAFSFIYNGQDRWRAKEAMDAMGVTLASFSR